MTDASNCTCIGPIDAEVFAILLFAYIYIQACVKVKTARCCRRHFGEELHQVSKTACHVKSITCIFILLIHRGHIYFETHGYTSHASSSSSSRSHLVVGSLRQTQFSSSHGSVMDLVYSRSDGSHVSVDTVHPSLLRSSSLSSPGWYHLQSLSSDVYSLGLAALRGQTT